MKKSLALVFLILAGLALKGCSGADEVSGPGDSHRVATPPANVTPHARPTPNPCAQNPADCD